MVRFKTALLVALLLGAALLMLMNACGGGTSQSNSSPPPPPPPPKIQHVVVIVQENRSTDNMFQDPVLIQRGADIQNYGVNSKGVKVPLTPVPLAVYWDNSHTHPSFLKMYDGGKMDGADLIPLDKCQNPCTPPPNRPFNYVQTSDVQPYFTLAETYTFGDRMFQTNQGPSLPAHQFLISGTSAPTPPGKPNSNLFVADNQQGGPNQVVTGCLAAEGQYTLLIDPANPDPTTNETQKAFPCYDHPTLTDLLDTKGISWRYYAWAPGFLWTGPNAIQHICVPTPGTPNATACSGSIWQRSVVLNSPQVLTDIQNGQLPSVSWVTPSIPQSDHAGNLQNNEGPSWVASIVNTIGSSPYWSNTAIIITWDDWGGWYDHVAPPVINSYEYGFRVPLIVVSPYAKPAYVSHEVNDFGSILKFIEETFDLPTVAPGATPPYADVLTNTGDLSDCFDFTQMPLTFHAVQARLDASYFLHDTRPPENPDDD
jgi:phospholipase C